MRRSARVLLFNGEGEVLLIRFLAQLESGPFRFWVTPGGEVEAGEDDRAAAARELEEELGIRPLLTGPVHQETGGIYTHLGETVRNFDVFFAAISEQAEPTLKGVTSDEIRLMQEARWWSLHELRTTEEKIFPERLPELAERIFRALRQP